MGPYNGAKLVKPAYFDDIHDKTDREYAASLFASILGLGDHKKSKPRIIEVHGTTKNRKFWILAAFGIKQVTGDDYNWIRNNSVKNIIHEIYYDTTILSRSKNMHNDTLCGALIITFPRTIQVPVNKRHSLHQKIKHDTDLLSTSEYDDQIDDYKYNPRECLKIKKKINNSNRHKRRKFKKTSKAVAIKSKKQGFLWNTVDFLLGVKNND